MACLVIRSWALAVNVSASAANSVFSALASRVRMRFSSRPRSEASLVRAGSAGDRPQADGGGTSCSSTGSVVEHLQQLDEIGPDVDQPDA